MLSRRTTEAVGFSLDFLAKPKRAQLSPLVARANLLRAERNHIGNSPRQAAGNFNLKINLDDWVYQNAGYRA